MIVWTKEFDRTILNGVKAGRSAAEIAIDLGPTFTRNMVIGRHKRLRGIVAPSERERGEREQAERLERARLRAELVAAAMAIVDRQIKKGLRRDFIVVNAYRTGLSFREIGNHFGFSHEWARQIVLKETAAAAA